jgi:glutamate synthase domain-containing protein 2
MVSAWATAAWLWTPAWLFGFVVLPFVAAGVQDMVQRRHAIRRNFPVLGRLRYLFESIRPELRQYFVESDQEANPFSREQRAIVYQRSKLALSTLPFGTRQDVYERGHEWISHSLAPQHPDPASAFIIVGASRCKHPYRASLFNISAMSYGSLSANAILALNQGAKLGGFVHNTGEGGISPYHLEPGGDLTWQIGTGYFGCRTPEGRFDESMFRDNAARESVKMIEVKLSQGAKPGHGGILPAKKVTEEIARIRGVPLGRDVLSPPSHSAFEGPRGLITFLAKLRELSGGKPVGFKLCLGNPIEFLSVLKAMIELDEGPDFITIDGGEGGTGAAPLEFSNSVGAPLRDGLIFIDDALRAAGLRDGVKLFSAGKIASGFDVVHQLALGADACNSARSMMFALGCIQALKCNSNHCPAGVATQDPQLMQGLVVEDKATRVANFHAQTVGSVLELCGAAGLRSPEHLRRYHIMHRTDEGPVLNLGAIHPSPPAGALLRDEAPADFQRLWDLASADRYRPNA